MLIGATNHTEMLDRAVVRRFQHHWTLPKPCENTISNWFELFSLRYPHLPIQAHKEDLLKMCNDMSLSDIEKTLANICRKMIIEASAKASVELHADDIA